MKLCEWESYGWGEPTVHWFLGGKGLGIQQETSVWVGSTKSNHLIWAYLSFIQYNSYKLICLEVTLSTPIIPFNVGPKMCWLRRDYGRERDTNLLWSWRCWSRCLILIMCFFVEYSCTRKNVIQLVPNLVWWRVYGEFLMISLT